MRTLIIYLGIMLVLVLSVVYNSDYIEVELTELALKHDINHAAKGAAMLINAEDYGDGYIVFDDSAVQKHVQELLTSKCDEYTINIFDHSNVYRKYTEDGYNSEESVSFPHCYTDVQGEDIIINEPCIIIDGCVKKEFYRNAELKNRKTEVIRSTMYVVTERSSV